MPNPNKRYYINFNLVLDDPTDAMLCRMAVDSNLSKAQVVRALLYSANEMRYRRTPTCADGQTCRCPHAHIYAPSQPPGETAYAPPLAADDAA